MRTKSTHKLIGALSLLMAAAFLIALALLAKTLYDSYGQKKNAEHLLDLYESGEDAESHSAAPGSPDDTADSANDEDAVDWSRGLSEINPDYSGWLTVFGTQVNYPVVQGEDNSYYLDHDFYGSKSIYGSLFLDSGNDLTADGNLLIYGHYMKDGQMLGSLNAFKDSAFFAENGLVRLETESGVSYYAVFALLIIPGSSEADDYLDLQEYMNELSDEAASKMLETLKNRAYFHKELPNSPDDSFLFLVTCDYTQTNGRLLLCAKRL